jgi:hypothetical protein
LERSARSAESILDVLEQPLAWLVELLVEHLPDPVPRHRRRRGAKSAELALVELAVFVGEEVAVDERGQLAHLHRHALHRPERVDQPLRRVLGQVLHPLLPAVPGAQDAAGLGAGEARALESRTGAEAHRAQQAVARDVVLAGQVGGWQSLGAAAG